MDNKDNNKRHGPLLYVIGHSFKGIVITKENQRDFVYHEDRNNGVLTYKNIKENN